MHCWIRSLAERPKIRALCLVDYANDGEMEELVIAAYRSLGFDLVNATDGGEGKKGCFHSEESKAKIRAWGIGRKMPPISEETRERMAAAQRGKKQTAEHRAKIAAAGIGRPKTKGNTGNKASSEARANMRAAWTNASAEVKALKSLKLKQAHERRRASGISWLSDATKDKLRIAQLAHQANLRWAFAERMIGI